MTPYVNTTAFTGAMKDGGKVKSYGKSLTEIGTDRGYQSKIEREYNEGTRPGGVKSGSGSSIGGRKFAGQGQQTVVSKANKKALSMDESFKSGTNGDGDGDEVRNPISKSKKK